MRDLLLIATILFCALVALRRPVFGILTFVCLGLLNPHSMTWASARTFPLSQLVAIGTIVGTCFWTEAKRFPRQREVFLLLALWGVFGFSTSLAFFPDVAWSRFIDVSKILLMVFLLLYLINTQERLVSLLYVIALSLGFYGLKGGIFVITSGGGYIVWGPEESFLYANNAIGLALDMNLPVLAHLLKTETRPWLRWLMRSMFLFSYPAIICTYSRGAWLGLVIVTVLLVWKSAYRLRLIAGGSVLALFLLPILLQLAPEQLVKRYDNLVNYEQESSAMSRFWNWELCKRVGLARPLHGGGFSFYSTEMYELYYPEFLEQWGSEKVWTCHSTWLTLLGEHGIPGFLLWLTLFLSVSFSLRRLRIMSKAATDCQWVTPYVDMLQVAFLAFIIVGTFFDAAYFDLLYYLIATLVILKERMADVLVQHSAEAVIPARHFPFTELPSARFANRSS